MQVVLYRKSRDLNQTTDGVVLTLSIPDSELQWLKPSEANFQLHLRFVHSLLNCLKCLLLVFIAVVFSFFNQQLRMKGERSVGEERADSETAAFSNI